MQLQDAHAVEAKKIGQELEEVRANMKKTQLRADEVQGTFETHNGEYLRMKVQTRSVSSPNGSFC